jgi:hypothetical protein
MRGGQVTQYQNAEFDVACVNTTEISQLLVQFSDNQPAIVTYRAVKGQPESETVRVSNPDILVEQAIRAVCSCSSQ